MLKSEIKKITQKSIAYSLGDFINYIINFLLFPIYIKMLTPKEYGILLLVTLFGTLVRMLMRLGLNDGFMRLYFDYSDKKSRKELLGATYYGLSAINIMLFIPLYLLIDKIAWLFLYDSDLDPDRMNHLLSTYTPLFTVMLIACFARSFLNIPFTLLRTEERAKSFALISIVRFLTNMTLKIIFVAVLKWNIHGIVMVDLITSFFFTSAFLPIVWKKVSLRLNIKMLGNLLSFGVPKVPHNMAHHLLNQADRYIISRFLNLASVGIYGIGYTIGMALKFFTYAFNMAWTPHSFKIHNEPDAPMRIARFSTYNLTFQLFTAVGISLFARELLVLLDAVLKINPKWFDALPIVPLVAFAYVFQAAYFLTNIGISISKKTKYYPVVTGISLIINIVFNILLIPIFGIIGAAVTANISYASMAALALFFGQKHYRIDWEWKRLLKAFVTAVSIVVLSKIADTFDITIRLPMKFLLLLLFPAVLWQIRFLLKSEAESIKKILFKSISFNKER